MNSTSTVDLKIESREITHKLSIQRAIALDITKLIYFTVLTTSILDACANLQLRRDAVVTVSTKTNELLVCDLGWTREQAIETYLRLRGFEEDWDAPGMEIYDEL